MFYIEEKYRCFLNYIFSGMDYTFMGIKIGGTKIQVFLTDDSRILLNRTNFLLRKEAGFIVES